MNEKFFELSKEKQLNIINASMEVFGNNEYKRAITDDIAAKAGISKGLLFYYFKNKKALYLYIYQYCLELMKELMKDEDIAKINDFFDIMEYGAQKKLSILCQYPYIMEFVIRAFYSQQEDVSDFLSKDIQAQMSISYQQYFSQIDYSRFKDDVDPAYIFQMMQWMMDGYLRGKMSLKKPLDVEEMMETFHKWKVYFRKMAYKEEYQ